MQIIVAMRIVPAGTKVEEDSTKMRRHCFEFGRIKPAYEVPIARWFLPESFSLRQHPGLLKV